MDKAKYLAAVATLREEAAFLETHDCHGIGPRLARVCTALADLIEDGTHAGEIQSPEPLPERDQGAQVG
jgi:hypothetical protein